MAKNNFETVADDLTEAAVCMVDYLRLHGYSVKIEPTELGYPYTPALVARRRQTQLIINIDRLGSKQRKLKQSRISQWVGYIKSSNKDMRYCVCSDLMPDVKDDQFFRRNGIGYFAYADGGISEIIQSKDISLSVELPDLSQLSRKLRVRLGAVYEQFDRSDWREGFEDACKVLEEEARKYLKSHMRTGRVVVLDNGGRPKRYRGRGVDGLTMGQLAHDYGNIQNQNLHDKNIADALGIINSDRIAIVHKKGNSSTETKLRRNVGRHMWRIVGTLKEILD